eukprot:TRINITY_DN4525_c0_g1_i2.p1 TRINITY_DN4525_c0_g1~~TRINITY_DN4525_c0_g1_i2.p1  ORF type:complete len:751 (+),score=267.97 TRINITY_DN4525_c0_g1_i2:103-2355(+)
MVAGQPSSATYTLSRGTLDGEFGWVLHNSRLEIMQLRPGGCAEQAGLQVGMKIRAINDQSVRTVDQLFGVVRHLTEFTVKVDIPQAPGSPGRRREQSSPNPLETYRAHQHSQADHQQYVTVQNLVHPPSLRHLNGQRGRLMQVRRDKVPATALVRFVNAGVHELPVTHLHVVGGGGGVHADIDDPFHNLKFPPGIEEIVVRTNGADIIGLQLDRMVLTGVRTDTPADEAKVMIYNGWRLTHVNGKRVVKTEDVPAAAQGSGDVVLRFEVEEITVRKQPNEAFGLELTQEDLRVLRANPGTPAAQYDLGNRFHGYVLTHINGFRASQLADVAALVMGCDSVRVRFEPSEVVIHRQRGENLGMKIEGMVLTGSLPGTPTKRWGVDKFLGRRLTHVNLHPVFSIDDIRVNVQQYPLGMTPEGEERVSLRFELPVGEEDHPPLLQSYAANAGHDGMGALVPVTPAAPEDPPPAAAPPRPALSPPSARAAYSPNYSDPHREVFTTPTFVGGARGFQPPHATAAASAAHPFPVGVGSPGEIGGAPPLAAPMAHPIRVPPGYHTSSPTGGVTGDGNPHLAGPYDQSEGVERPSRQLGQVDRLLYDLRLEREARHNDEQNERIRRLETRLSVVEGGGGASPRRIAAAAAADPPRDAAPLKSISPARARRSAHPAAALRPGAFSEPLQGVGRTCSMCGDKDEIECRDCGLVFCAPCCAEVHQAGRLRVTHTNMVPTTRPTAVRYPYAAAETPRGSGRYY